MTAAAVLIEAVHRGVSLTPTPGGSLDYDGPDEALDDAFLDALAAHKDELVAMLTVAIDWSCGRWRRESGLLVWTDRGHEGFDFDRGATLADVLSAEEWARAHETKGTVTNTRGGPAQ